MRVAPTSVQLALPDPVMNTEGDRWWSLPEQTRTHVLSLLAALIARGVLIDPVAPVECSVEPEGEGGDGEGSAVGAAQDRADASGPRRLCVCAAVHDAPDR